MVGAGSQGDIMEEFGQRYGYIVPMAAEGEEEPGLHIQVLSVLMGESR